MAKRLNIEVSDDVAELISRIADQQNVSMSEMVRRTLGVLKVAEQQKAAGREIGFVDDPAKLDTAIVGFID